MRIAVASQNFRTVTGHVGRTRRFFIFEAVPGEDPREVDRLDMPKHMALHEYRGEGPHPLYEVEVIIAGSVGAGFASRIGARGIRGVATSETDPAEAARAFVEGRLAELPVEEHRGPEHGHHHHDHD